jgi:hypothetical protein
MDVGLEILFILFCKVGLVMGLLMYCNCNYRECCSGIKASVARNLLHNAYFS